MSEAKLLPCPFCRSSAELDQFFINLKWKDWKVLCSNEECCGGKTLDDGYRTEAEAIEAWNTRPDQWRPIETAPKQIEILVSKGKKRFVAELCFGKWWWKGVEIKIDPTHWMPLPSPPE